MNEVVKISDQLLSIKAIVLDVDGTLTDGSITIGSNGEEYKSFNVKDGLAITLLHKMNITPIIITGRSSNIVSKRCEELNIKHVYQGIKDKRECLDNLLHKIGLDYSNIAYIGDDINDIQAASTCSLVFAVADACKEYKEIAHYISSYKGGKGAVRECVDWLLNMRKINCIDLYFANAH